MNGTRGKETILEIRRDGEDHTMLIQPVSWSAWNGLAYQDELRRNREKVDELSDGQLGYLHIRGMNMPSVHEFEHQLYAAAHGKDGLVIDVRNNGGGWTTDVLTSLTAPVHSSTIPRGVAWEDAPKEAYPRDRRLIYAWSKPIVVLANEHSFSNAEIFTHAIKNTDRGTVVGEETYGGVISTGSFTLVDGSSAKTIPRLEASRWHGHGSDGRHARHPCAQDTGGRGSGQGPPARGGRRGTREAGQDRAGGW